MVRFSTDHPKIVTGLVLLATVILGSFIATVDVAEDVDTDPENMLSKSDPVRLTHDRLKEDFNIYDMIVVGVVNEDSPDGVFNPQSLRKIHALTEYAKGLRGAKLSEPFSAAEVDAVLESQDTAESTSDEPDGAGPSEPAVPDLPPGLVDQPPLPPLGDTDVPALPAIGGHEDPPPPPTGLADDPTHAGDVSSAPLETQTNGEADDFIGVVPMELLSLSTVDRIEHEPSRPGSTGSRVRFSRLMPSPPASQEGAQSVLEGALDNPLLNGTVVSEDGKAAAIYLPITQKDISYRVSQRVKAAAEHLGGPEQYHITGLPVAEDTFGHEMFIQMAISAPLAMLVIFILLFVFFRKVVLIVSPMIVAMVSVIVTMGLLIGMGYTVHIMSSMIPIFIMPIAVLDAIHILSEFFDRYQATRDRRATIHTVMEELFTPMLYTSLTSAAGFASLALTPIPPVQVFGMFVAFGIMLAWLLTVTFIPAYVMFIPERRLEGFGVSHAEEAPDSSLTRVLRGLGHFTRRHGKLVLTATGLILAVAVWGISRININDNPTKWFTASHPIRVADRVMNRHFAGTYQAYLALSPQTEEFDAENVAQAVTDALAERVRAFESRYSDESDVELVSEYRRTFDHVAELVRAQPAPADSPDKETAYFEGLMAKLEATGDGSLTWGDAISTVQGVRNRRLEHFKRPDVLGVVEQLQRTLPDVVSPDGRSLVGKSNSLVDIVKKVNLELHGSKEYNRIPGTYEAVGQTIQQFQNSNRPNDLWHFTTPDFGRANVWLQLKSGDNKDMEEVIDSVDGFMQDHPEMDHEWFGLTYINVKWQEKMVAGMLQAFIGSFLVVLILMTVLFHSALWGLLCMIPLTVTIGLIYGIIGLVGKDYDMPVAVLSSLTLGLAVDFAIHFLARSRALVREHGSWKAAIEPIFGEPARAISRNAIVVAVGFLPLLAAPLVPYKTVGFFMAGILSVAAVGTLLILPALVTSLRDRLFQQDTVRGITCKCAASVVASAAAVVLLALSYQSFAGTGWNTPAIICAVGIPLATLVSGAVCRRRTCRRIREEQKTDNLSEQEG